MAQRLVRAKKQDPRRQHPLPRARGDAELPDRLRAGARRRLPHLQRGPHRELRRSGCVREDLCAEAIRLGAAARRADARRARGAGPAGAAAADRAAAAGAHGRRRARSCCSPTRTVRCGTATLIAEGQDLVRALPAAQPARSVPDPGGDRRRARGCADRGGHRLVADRAALRPADATVRRARSSRSTVPSPWPRWTGPAPALAVVDALDLDTYHPFHATRADLLRQLGSRAEAARRLRPCDRADRERDRARVPRVPARRGPLTAGCGQA